jgi:hypothetical protein
VQFFGVTRVNVLEPVELPPSRSSLACVARVLVLSRVERSRIRMSQRSVERVIGKLVTDEAFRRRFSARPQSTLQETAEGGLELTACEMQALAALDKRVLEQFAEAIDPRLQKTDIHGGVH